MSVIKEPGYRPIMKEARDPRPLQENLWQLADFARRHHLLRMGPLDVYNNLDEIAGEKLARERYRDLIYAVAEPNQELSTQDLGELAQSPIFKFGEGFTSLRPPEITQGNEPPVAPLNIEQMRLLLTRVLGKSAPQVVPLFEERFVFEYDLNPHPNSVPDGPRVDYDSVNEKVVITFYKDHFITRGKRSAKPSTPYEKAADRYVWGFVDPSKIALFFGKIIAQMTEPPPNWPIRQNPGITSEKISKSNRRRIARERSRMNRQQQSYLTAHKQWEDFVGLCVTLPEEAKRRYPDSYQHYQKQLERFSDPGHDQIAIDQLRDLNTSNAYELRDFNTTADLRSDEEKAAANPPSPQRNFFDKVYRGLNTALAPFGYKLTFEMPEDEERSELLAKDNDRIAYLIENYDQETRDVKFGEILATYPDYDTKGRNLARQYLLAASKEGEFSEWRIYAWLYKFSKKFRNPGLGKPMGSEISEDDYKDLKMIHSVAEGAGIVGASVLPYKQELYHDPRAGRDLFIYIRRNDYLEKLRQKLSTKNARAVWDANVDKAFGEFYPTTKSKPKKDYLDYDAIFTPAVIQTMLQVGNPQVAQELTDALAELGVGRISTTTKALAEAYYYHYQTNKKAYEKLYGANADEYTNQFTAKGPVDTVLHYEKDLIRAPREVDEFIAEIPPDKAAAMTPEARKDRVEKSEEQRERVVNTLAKQLSLLPLRDYTEKIILDLVNANIVNVDVLKTRIDKALDDQRSLYASGVDQQKREAHIALSRAEIRKTFEQLAKVVDYIEAIEPHYAPNIQEVAEQLKNVRDINTLVVVPPEVSAEEYRTEFESRNIRLTGEDMAMLRATEASLGPLISGEDDPLVKQKRAQLLRDRIAQLNTDDRLKLVTDIAEGAVNDFRANVLSSPNDAALKKWLQANGIFRAEALKEFTTNAESLIHTITTIRPELRSKYVDQLNDLVKSFDSAIIFVRPQAQSQP